SSSTSYPGTITGGTYSPVRLGSATSAVGPVVASGADAAGGRPVGSGISGTPAGGCDTSYPRPVGQVTEMRAGNTADDTSQGPSWLGISCGNSRPRCHLPSWCPLRSS